MLAIQHVRADRPGREADRNLANIILADFVQGPQERGLSPGEVLGYTMGMASLTVLGIGNILMRDEGIGVLLMEAVRAHRLWPAEVEFIDGGVGGLNLLNVIEDAQRLIVFDAADMSLSPGDYRVIQPEQIRQEDLSTRVSLHQAPFVETLKLCEQFSHRPPTTILAIQPAVVEYGRDLSQELSVALDNLLEAGVEMVETALAL